MENKELSKSLKIGITLTVTYIASYFMRNMLSVLTPAMLQTTAFTKEYIGILSSVYMAFYAAGQLTNGILGDYIPPKYMILCGLLLTGTAAFVFPLSANPAFEIICFAFLGYGLSMLRGPMMKVISENTKPNHARVICAFFGSATFLGAIIASLFAAAFRWNRAFQAAGAVIYIIALATYIILTRLEKRGLLAVKKSDGKTRLDIFGAFKADKFLYYIIISILAEITTSAINFWIPTYLTENLGFANNDANMIYIVKSIIHSSAPFIAIFLFNSIKDEFRIIKRLFLTAAVLFAVMLFVRNPVINIVLFFASLLASGVVSGTVWSIYIPSLKSTGKVSSANGILDCAGYAGAALANFVFAFTMNKLGWNGMILLWALIMLVGVIVTTGKDMKTKKSV